MEARARPCAERRREFDFQGGIAVSGQFFAGMPLRKAKTVFKVLRKCAKRWKT